MTYAWVVPLLQSDSWSISSSHQILQETTSNSRLSCDAMQKKKPVHIHVYTIYIIRIDLSFAGFSNYIKIVFESLFLFHVVLKILRANL